VTAETALAYCIVPLPATLYQVGRGSAPRTVPSGYRRHWPVGLSRDGEAIAEGDCLPQRVLAGASPLIQNPADLSTAARIRQPKRNIAGNFRLHAALSVDGKVDHAL
jgi:hypothetical protein